MPRAILPAFVLCLSLLPAVATAQQGTGAPQWFPLSADQEKYLDDVLKYWEYQAAQIQRYRCQFKRWEFDPVVLPKHPDIAATFANGTIQFAAPDKGLFKVDKLWQIAMQKQGDLTVPVVKDGRPEYTEQQQAPGEHWVCDGKATFQFDALNKQLIRRDLPPDMQGKQIAEGPLPFLFGAKAQSMKERYWMRVVTPPPIKGHFLLEAIPKRREEAADYLAIQVVIDEKEFLPTDLILYDRVGGKTRYEFGAREKNWSMLPAMLNPFHQQFFAPKAPEGWKEVVEPFRPDPEPAVAPPPVTRAPQASPIRR